MTAVVDNLVSTIIPVFNRPEMLRLAVSSVLAQTHRPIEIIIADDGSTDETPRVAAELVAAHAGLIHYVRHGNAGPGPTRELGRRHANGEFIQYLDSDDLLRPNKFADQIKALRLQEDCEVAYGITRLVDDQGNVLADPFKWTGREISALFPGLLVDRWWCTHTPLYRRRLTDRIGDWSDLRWSQDWEYDSRIGALGVKLVNCQSHVSDHVEHQGQRQTSAAQWTTDPVRLNNRLQLIRAIWRGASQAGVPPTAPERQHFARWCFTIGRHFAAQSMSQQANECFELALEASGPKGAGRQGVVSYRLLFNTLGASVTNWMMSLVQRIRTRPGSSTMDQSFANDS